jgi:hypothetical protein
MVEVMVALAGFLVVIVGALSFQYYCAVDTREADVRAGANRIALLLLEGWRGSGGRVPPHSNAYNPIVELGGLLNIEGTAVGLAGLSSGELGRYKIDANRANYFATLSWLDNVIGPRTLGVTVAWSASYRADVLDEYVRYVTLTTNTEND